MPLDVVVDPGERILRLIEELVGARPLTCPWQAMRDPFVCAVLGERRWWDRGEPRARREALPRALVDGLEEYELALTAVLVHDARIEREQAEKKRDRGRRPAGVPRSFARPPTRGGRWRR